MPLLIAAADPEDKDIVLDGVALPQVTDVSYVFRCNEDTIRIAYRTTHLDPDDVPLREAMRATLARLSVTRRQITRAGFAEADRLLRSFATVERVEARCVGGRIYLWVIGRPHDPWFDFIEGKTKERPRSTIGAIGISRSGAVTTRR
ncbi:MAG TPA: hypothetical protein VEA60_02185 [Allosphingosinicella sp.]|nr:hypothetical protein [Allosphingosinicella sp.]